jgi:hypothetical protein
LPPLDADFFRQAQRLDEEDFAGDVQKAVSFVREEYGSTRLPTLETVFTQLQGFEAFLQKFAIRRGRRSGVYQRQLEYLLEMIVTVFRAAFAEQTCDWHDRVAYALRKGDAVISFNYDTLIDDAIRRWSTGIWKADRGYGFRIKPADGANRWTAEKPRGPFPQKNYLRLLKPHGSLHWEGVDPATKHMCLLSTPYSRHTAKGSIIPPTWDKAILGEWPWKQVWEEASRALQRTRCLVVIGYSVPQTDLTTQALIRSSLGGSPLRLLVVANPDPEARGRVIDLARGAVVASTRIIEFETLRDFAELLDETPDERQRREATSRNISQLRARLRDLNETMDDLDDRTESLSWTDVGDLEARIDDLESTVSAVDEISDRVDALEAAQEDE